MEAFDGEKESPESERDRFRDAHAAALAALASIPDLAAAESVADEIKRAAEELRSAHDELELRIRERTSELTRANAELQLEIEHRKQAQERFYLTVESSPSAMVVVGQDGKIVLVNSQTEKFFGYAREELIGQSVEILVPERFRRRHPGYRQDFFHQPVARPMGVGRDLYGLRKDGSEFPVEIGLNPVRTAEGVLILSAIVDITERKRAEQERAEILAREQEARRQAEDANRLKDEFLATLSHELRTPMTAIIGWVHLLRGGMLDEESVGRALETIERNARSQAQLIEDLLDISRVITGKVRLETHRVELIHVIEAAADSIRPTAEAKKIELRITLDPGAGWVQGDPGRLQQVVWNLLSNAVKFTPQGGRVELRLERAGAEALLTVSDTGEGIAPEFLPHVFDRFRQADGSMTRAHGGLGLGLAIVRHLTELHGGTVAAESRGRGQGATFTLRLPLLESRAADGAARGAEPKAGAGQLPTHDPQSAILRGLRVLLVEDERDARELFAIALRRFGAEVTAVESAAQALDALGREKTDVMVSDIQMPEMDGYELIGAVRALKANGASRVPAVAMTAHARSEDRMRSLLAGYQAHLSKPVEPAELVALLAALTGRTGHHH